MPAGSCQSTPMVLTPVTPLPSAHNPLQLIEELGTMVFYFTSGYQFRPLEDNPYLNLQQEDFDDVALRAEIEAAEMEMTVADSPKAVR